jgi:hypothetical protein
MSGKERMIGMKFRKFDENQIIVKQLIKIFFMDWKLIWNIEKNGKITWKIS